MVAVLLLLVGGCAFKGTFEGGFAKDSGGDGVSASDLGPDALADLGQDTASQAPGLLVYLECIQTKDAKGPDCVSKAGVPAAQQLELCRNENCFEWGGPDELPEKPGFKPEDLEICLLTNCLPQLAAGGDGSGSDSPCRDFLNCTNGLLTEPDPFLDTYRCTMAVNPDSADLQILDDMVLCYFQWRLSTMAGVPDVKGVCKCFLGCGYAPGLCD
jgi:hypothetical protein